MLGSGPIGALGAFSITINDLALGNKAMLVEAEASLQPATIYRILDIGSLGSGGGGGGRVASPESEGGGADASILEIDPSSEGAMRSLASDPNPLGLDAYSNDDIQRLVELTRAGAGNYAGETAEQAAQEARAIANELGVPHFQSFVASSSQYSYHVLSSGAFAHHFTTLFMSTLLGSRTCVNNSGVLRAAAVSAFLTGANSAVKSQIFEGSDVIFNPTAGNAGQICVGVDCTSEAFCPPMAPDCHLFQYGLNATALSSATAGVPAAQGVLISSNAFCALDESAYAFGTMSPTISIAVNSQKPGDGFTLPANTTIVFSQQTMAGAFYTFGFGGYRLRNGLTVSGAVAEVDEGEVP